MGANHGAKVAQWRHLLFVATLGYSLGGLLLSENTTKFYASWKSAGDISLFLSIFSTVGCAVVGLGISSFFGYPMAVLPALLISLFFGARIANVDFDLLQIFRVILSNVFVLFASLLLSTLAHTIISRFILRSKDDDPLSTTLKTLPLLFLFILPVSGAAFIYLALRPYTSNPTILLSLSLGIFVLVAVGTALWSKLLMVNRTKRHVFERFPQHFLEYVPTGGEERLAERGMVVGRESPIISGRDSGSTLNRQRAEESFAFILLAFALLSGALQGAIDVGAIREIFLVILKTIRVDKTLFPAIPFWQVLLLNFSGATGILALGNRLTRRLSNDLVNISPSMAVCVELGCYFPILLALILRYPVSPILCKLTSIVLVAKLAKRELHKKAVLQFLGGVVMGPLVIIVTVLLGSYIGTFVTLPST